MKTVHSAVPSEHCGSRGPASHDATKINCRTCWQKIEVKAEAELDHANDDVDDAEMDRVMDRYESQFGWD